jgi:RHS repeat-associated protein
VSFDSSYDAAGNTTSDGTHAYTYSARNRMASARLQSTNTVIARYATNAFGERVCKASAGGACPQGPGSAQPADAGSGSFSQYVYDEAGHLLGEYSDSGALIAEHVWLEDTPVALIKPIAWATSHGGQTAGTVAVFAVEPDHLDTPRVLANSTHQVIWRWDSSPFGDTPAEESPTGLAAFRYSLRFPGQQYDPETQSHYNYFRDYEPGTGRYLESDPAGLYFSINSFAYVYGAPLQWFDWSGLGRIGDFTKIQREDQFAWNPRCYYCGKKTIRCATPHPDRFNMDHFEALATGGTGDTSNGVSSCQTCNLRKATKSGAQFLRTNGTWKGFFFGTWSWLTGRGRR